jgi:Tfp pilus assembly protein PilW
MAPRSTPVHHRHSSTSQGFTIVELVIAAAIGAVVIGSVAAYTLIEFRSNATQDLNLQLSDEGKRAADWIDSEISRASGFDNIVTTGCTPPTGTSLVMSLHSPGTATTEVSYFSPTGTNLGNVVRCGPPVVCISGSACGLDTAGTNATYLVVSNARLSVGTTLSGTAVRQITYTLTVQQSSQSSTITRTSFAGAPTGAGGVY